MDAERLGRCGPFGDGKRTSEEVSGVQQHEGLLVGDVRDDAARQLRIGGVFLRQKPVRSHPAVAGDHLESPALQPANQREIGQTIPIDRFGEACNPFRIHRVGEVAGMLLDVGQANLPHGKPAGSLRSGVEKPADTETVGHIVGHIRRAHKITSQSSSASAS